MGNKNLTEFVREGIMSEIGVQSWIAEEYIRMSAYYLWQNAGQPEGKSLEFWFAAERELFHFTAYEEKELFI